MTGKLLVLSGLPASGKTTLLPSGKTTLLRELGSLPNIGVVPEFCEWLPEGTHIPSQPNNVAEKMAKQEWFFQIDLERYRKAKDLQNSYPVVVCDTDFTGALAYNFAEKKLRPDMDVYSWLVERHVEALVGGNIVPADGYLVLDLNLKLRQSRHDGDVKRKRNPIFFDPIMTTRMHQFFLRVLSDHGETIPMIRRKWIYGSVSLATEIAEALKLIESLAVCAGAQSALGMAENIRRTKAY